MISAVILAAGKSERMGKVKQLMLLNGSSILERTIQNYLKSEAVSEVILVLGSQAGVIRKRIDERQIKVVTNADYEQGMSTSIVAGVRAISDTTSGVMVAMGDQPFITSLTIKRLVEEYKKRGKGIVAPIYRGKRGQPVIFGIKYKHDLLSLKGDSGARDVIKRNIDDVLEVPVGDNGVLFDIDTEEEYKDALERIRNFKS